MLVRLLDALWGDNVVAWFFHTLFVSPIKWFMELFLSVMSSSLGIFSAVVLLSVFVNMLLSPVQRSISGMREDIWVKSDKVRERSIHIRHTFVGVERQMVLSAYYREQGYSPLLPLLLAVPTLVQIPFFIAAWEAITLSEKFYDVSFFGLFLFGSPDSLFYFGDFAVNLLPLLMTVINLVTAYVVMRGRKISESIGSFVLPFVFLVLLYEAPSGMVLYWTTSQVISLCRELVVTRFSQRVKHVLLLMVSLIVVVLTGCFSFAADTVDLAWASVVTAVFVMAVFVRLNWLSGVWSLPDISEVLSFAGLSLAFGLMSSVLFPLVFIHGNMSDFSVGGLDYGSGILVSGLAAVGFYGIVLPLLFFFCLPHTRRFLNVFAFGCCVLALVCSYVVCDYRYDGLYDLSCVVSAINFNGIINLISTYAVLSVFGIVFYLSKRLNKVYGWFSLTLIGVVVAYCVIGLPDVFDSYSIASSNWEDHYLFSEDGQLKQFLKLSKTEKNVVVFFLDNAASHTMESIFMAMPELAEPYDGFTLYSNTLSCGDHTIYGNMPLYAGYDYWVGNLLSDDGVSLADKENAAQLLMPRLFSEAGFTTSVVSPPLSGDFTWGEDFSAFDAEGDVESYTKSKLYEGGGNDFYGFNIDFCVEQRVFMFGFMRAVPQFAKNIVSNNFCYGNTEDVYAPLLSYVNEHMFLDSLCDFTSVDDCFGHFSVMHSLVVHDVCDVDYDAGAWLVDRNTVDVDNIDFDRGNNYENMHSYFENFLVFITRFGDWLDYLKDEGVYDNTRIIIVADHGAIDVRSQNLDNTGFYVDGFNPLLMVKDFDAHGFSISDEFMTNADAPLLAMDGIVDNPVNPTTGHVLSDDAKNEPLVVTVSDDYNPEQHSENYFLIDDSELGTFDGGDIVNRDNWHLEVLGD